MLPQAIVYPLALATAAFVGWRAAVGGRPAREVAFRVLLTLYVGWIVSMTLFPLPLDPAFIRSEALRVGFHWNMVPFRTIAAQAGHLPSWQSIRQLGGNVLVFVPFGVLLPLAAPSLGRFWRMLLAGLAFSVAIELAQLAVSVGLGYTYRVSDIDDVILNVAGVLLGYAAYRLGRRRATR